ncbi:MAG: hypothetical protein Q9217_003183 [Psora testacea]
MPTLITGANPLHLKTDTLSMLLATAFVMDRVLTFDQPSHENRKITAALSLSVLAFSIIHCIVNNLNLHSAVFATMILIIALRIRAIIKRVKDVKQREHATSLAWLGGGKFVLNASRTCQTLTPWTSQYAQASDSCFGQSTRLPVRIYDA